MTFFSIIVIIISNITKSQGMDVGRVLQPVVLSLGGFVVVVELLGFWSIRCFSVFIFLYFPQKKKKKKKKKEFFPL